MRNIIVKQVIGITVMGLCWLFPLCGAAQAQERTAVVTTDSTAIGSENARHLLNRAGFGASLAEIDAVAKLSLAEAAKKIVGESRERAALPAPEWVGLPVLAGSKLNAMTQEQRLAELRLNNQRTMELRDWWVREMLTTPSPLTEKMTLFWHNHFATSQQKVRSATLVYRQHVTLRQYALGNFKTLLHAMARDPAMLIYLDNANSRKEQPNENFAREVMELFTLGEGHYTEQDIKEVARAFTGWSLDRETGEFMFRRGIHDSGQKTIFGKRGAFDGGQVLDLLLARPETAQFITRKLWREFISPTPDEKEVARMAGIYQESGYNTAKLMETMLASDAFYAAENRASLIKSPVELIVGTLKTFDVTAGNVRPFVLGTAFLGQNLFAPPNVKGWPGGEAWINSTTLLGRKQFVARLFSNEDRMDAPMRGVDQMAEQNGDLPLPARAMRQQRQAERAMAALNWNLDRWAEGFRDRRGGQEGMAKMVLATAPRLVPGKDTSPAEWARTLVADPAYQLK